MYEQPSPANYLWSDRFPAMAIINGLISPHFILVTFATVLSIPLKVL